MLVLKEFKRVIPYAVTGHQCDLFFFFYKEKKGKFCPKISVNCSRKKDIKKESCKYSLSIDCLMGNKLYFCKIITPTKNEMGRIN